MPRALFALFILGLLALPGCASSPPPAPQSSARPLDDVRRLAIVSAGASSFTLVQHRSEPGRTLDEVLAWHPYGAALRPLAALVHRGINSVLKVDQQVAAARGIHDVTPGQVITDAMARRLRAAGAFEDVRVLTSEPVGDDRDRDAAMVRVTVTAWGLVRVRGSDPDVYSGFSDIAGSLSVPREGVVRWEHREDVTGADQIPFESLRTNPQLAREQVIEVLDRAGERLATELLYARGAGR